MSKMLTLDLLFLTVENSLDKAFISLDDAIQGTVPKGLTCAFHGVIMRSERVRDRASVH